MNRDTTWKLVLTSGNPRVLVSMTRGFTPTTPPSLEALDCSRDPGEPRRGRGNEAPAEAESTDYSVVSGGSLFTDVRMWAEHGQGPGAGRQGGNQWQIPQARPEGRLGNRGRGPRGARQGAGFPGWELIAPLEDDRMGSEGSACVTPQEPQGTVAMGPAQAGPPTYSITA